MGNSRATEESRITTGRRAFTITQAAQAREVEIIAQHITEPREANEPKFWRDKLMFQLKERNGRLEDLLRDRF